ncbi:CDP-alcohol phosphatidyltransferase family protein [Enterovibrio paralichthyis]|uniref:CDP-alcohol phosphatidyltransferase family protein n=1 Tax=Enterovibrio paralichthyis TaxID=2853805 RepID=UPI001C475BD8|nr:CDP-alcohol phosphatidyltransferase family protein [Enterovibrio paralichthyis]MBV7299929.1 CDP-alcohol phosphatidyltransferase family protein [Enterovibrio paralichthyis]
MLDSFGIKTVRRPLSIVAEWVDELGISANQVTVAGFVIGALALPALAYEQYTLALVCIMINRVMDGLDGALARIQGITDAGGFLDISLDFLFYSMVPFGFVLANPEINAVAGAFLIFSFVGTGASFLAFAIMASKQGIDDPVYSNKSLYYMTGLTEGSETILCFMMMCIFPATFVTIAFVFGAMCWFTTGSRIYNGFQTLERRIR